MGSEAVTFKAQGKYIRRVGSGSIQKSKVARQGTLDMAHVELNPKIMQDFETPNDVKNGKI